MPSISDNGHLQNERTGRLSPHLDGERFTPGALPAGVLSMNGGPVVQEGAARALPKAMPENFVCMRGPCRHLMTCTSPAEVENADYEPLSTDRYCKALPGVLLELTESAVYGCSEWDPSPEDAKRKVRRAAYLRTKEGKACAAADVQRTQAREAARAKIDAEYEARKQASLNETIDLGFDLGDAQEEE